MHPNDVELVRVYTREPGGTIADETIPHVPAGTEVEIVVECEAGTAVMGLLSPYTLRVYVRDLMEHHEIDWHNDPTLGGGAPPYEGALADASWPALPAKHVISATTANFNKGHVYNVLAVLTVGADIISFAESQMFVIK